MTVGLLSLAAQSQGVGRVLLGFTNEPGIFKNLALGATDLFTGTAGYAYPGDLNNNQYPTNTATMVGTISQSITLPSNLLQSDVMVFRWSGTATNASGALQIARGAPGFTIVSDPGGVVVGGTSFNIFMSGVNGRITFQFATSVPTGTSIAFTQSSSYTNISNIILCKATDEAAILAATTPEQFFSDTYVTQYASIKSKVNRPMGWSNPNSGNVSQSRYLPPWQTSLAVATWHWATGAWAGLVSGTGTYTCASQPDATGAYVNGEMIQAFFTNSNSIASPTINSGGRGAIPILFGDGSPTGTAPTVGYIVVTGAANNGSGLIRLTADTTNITTASLVSVKNVGGTTEANGNWICTVIDPTHIDLTGSAFVHAYTSGGSLWNNRSTSITDNKPATLTYNSLLNAFLYQLNGQSGSIPYEFQIAFANRVNAHYWCNFNSYFDDTSVTAIATLVRANLNSALNGYFEYGNEIWNSKFPATALSGYQGLALGFPNNNQRRTHGWYALRYSQVMRLVTTAWSPRSTSQLKRVIAHQAYGATGGNNTYRFQGADLVNNKADSTSGTTIISIANPAVISWTDHGLEDGWPVVFTGGTLPSHIVSGTTYFVKSPATNSFNIAATAGGAAISTFGDTQSGSHTVTYTNPLYAALVGVNYSVSPERPVDKCEVLSYATYYSGGETCQFDENYKSAFDAGLNVNALTAAADDYASGVPAQMTSALNWLDNDIRLGTQSNGNVSGTQTLQDLNGTSGLGLDIYGGWETIAASYDASRAGLGQSPLTYECYEGAEACDAPSVGECTLIGIPTAYGGVGGKIYNLIIGYRHSSQFYSTTLLQYTQFLSRSHSRTPAQLLAITGTPAINPWALRAGDIYAATFTSWDATSDFNHS